jgi:glutathione S-transferase
MPKKLLMKLHWSSRSPFVRKVMVCAHEAGIAGRIEKVPTLVAMTRPNDELMVHNPLGKIPALITENGTVLFDSTVICEYFDSLHKKPRLFPKSAARRWQALRWHAFGDNMLDTLVLWRNEGLRPVVQQSPETIVGFLVKTQSALDALEKEAPVLAKTPFGIGHVAIGVALGYIDFRFPDLRWRDKRGRIAAWYESFAKRPSARATAPAEQ